MRRDALSTPQYMRCVSGDESRVRAVLNVRLGIYLHDCAQQTSGISGGWAYFTAHQFVSHPITPAGDGAVVESPLRLIPGSQLPCALFLRLYRIWRPRQRRYQGGDQRQSQGSGQQLLQTRKRRKRSLQESRQHAGVSQRDKGRVGVGASSAKAPSW